MKVLRRVTAIVGGLLVVIFISAGVTVAIAEYFPEFLPEGPKGEQGPRGERGPVGRQGATGATGAPGGAGESLGGGDAEESSGPADEEKHYYYGGKDLGTVAQHEQFCRSLRRQQDLAEVNDQEELEREGCRGGGLIARPSER